MERFGTMDADPNLADGAGGGVEAFAVGGYEGPSVAESKDESDREEGEDELPGSDDEDMPQLVSASSSSSSEDESAERRAVEELGASADERDEASESESESGGEGQRMVRIGRHVLLLGGDEDGEGEGLGGRPVRLRTALALVRHMMLANRGSETLEAMCDMLVRERSIHSPAVVAAFLPVVQLRRAPDAR